MKKRVWIGLTALLAIFLTVGSVLLVPFSEQKNDSVGGIRLNIETYLAGKNQPTHPSVVVFEEPWNGFRYWMAYSPYPQGDGEEENPCIAVSNDLYDWTIPFGLANPVADNEETNCDELKDPHLLYREDLDRLEVWYLGRIAQNLGGNHHDLILFRKYSDDGIHWSEYEVMDSVEYLSPSVYWDGEKYQMWSIGYDMWNTTGLVVYQESWDGTNWSEPVPCSIDGKREDIDIWHGSMFVYDNEYHFVYIGLSEKQNIYHCTSRDGIDFENKQVIIENDGWWRNFYRPTLVLEDGRAACIYGVINEVNEWYLSMSTGPELTKLQGISERDADRMHSMDNDVTDTHTPAFRVNQAKSEVRRFLRLKLLVFVLAEVLLMLVWPGLKTSKVFICAALSGNVILTGVHIFLRMQPDGAIQILCAAAAFLILNAIGFFALSYIYLWSKNKERR